jgi:hypothetical protein
LIWLYFIQVFICSFSSGQNIAANANIQVTGSHSGDVAPVLIGGGSK